MNFYPFHIGDYASATRHLSWLEDAAYRRLMDVYYVREEPIPSDIRQVYRLVVASTDEQRMAVDVVLEEFFYLTNEGYRHFRCDAEIIAANDKRAKASQSARARWGNAKNSSLAEQSQTKCNASDMRTHAEDDANESKSTCEGNAPNPNPNPNPNPKEENKKNKTTPPDGFVEFWNAYPKKIGKGEAEKAWRKIRPSISDCLVAIAIAKKSNAWIKDGGQYIPNPSTWLNQRRWEDEHEMNIDAPAGEKTIGGMKVGKNWC